MKLKNLTLAVLAASLGVASVAAQADVSVSGRINAGIMNDGTDTKVQNWASRVRVAASSELDNGLTVVGKYEFGVDLDASDNSNGALSTRIAYVGLKGGFGEVRIGHDWQTFYNFGLAPVDLANWGVCIGCVGYGRTGEAITYIGGGDAVKFGATVYATDEEHGDGYELGASTKLGGVSLSAAMRDTDATGSEPLYAIAAATSDLPVDVAANYQTRKNDGDSVSLHVGFNNAYVAYGKISPDGGTSADGFTVGYTHKMGPAKLWGEISDGDLFGTDSVIRTGLRYDF